MNEYPTHEIINLGIRLTRDTVKRIHSFVDSDAKIAFRDTKDVPSGKSAKRIDNFIEDFFRHSLHTYYKGRFRKVVVWGEESPETLLPGSLVCLVDAVDGTDLVVRGLENWCCASVFYKFEANGTHIVAAFVGTPSNDIYYASDMSDSAYVINKAGTSEEVAGPSTARELTNASICFYGQKLKNLVSTIPFLTRLEKLQRRSSTARIYNLAGMPMMVKLVDRRIKSVSGIDVVFDCHGQKPHDTVAGLYIAMKGGAKAISLSKREPIGYAHLEDLLLDPASKRTKYVLGATMSLCRVVVGQLPKNLTCP